MAPEFQHSKGNYVYRIYKPVVLKDMYPLYHGASFYPLLVSFHLQITYRKVRNLQIGVDKLVGKVAINLLHHTKSATYLFSIIIDAPVVAMPLKLLKDVDLKKSRLMVVSHADK